MELHFGLAIVDRVNGGDARSACPAISAARTRGTAADASAGACRAARSPGERQVRTRLASRTSGARSEHDQLLARERVLGDQRTLAAQQVRHCPDEDRGGAGRRGGHEAPLDRAWGGTPGIGDAPQEASEQ